MTQTLLTNWSNSLKGPIYITGAAGMLGSDLVHYFSSQLPPGKVIASDSKQLDITSYLKVERELEKVRPSVVINAAAYTNVDGAETERDKAYTVNADGPAHLASVGHKLGIKLVHFSTDYVFDGDQSKVWSEDDAVRPPTPNYYAQTKLWGERAVLDYAEHIVLRVQWLYGRKKDRFTTLRNMATFTPFADQFGAPTWTLEVSRVVLELLLRDAKGLLQMAYDDYASWVDVFGFVKEELGLSTQLIPKRSEEVNLPAKRPKFGVMSNKKLLQTLGWESMGSWKKPLREFLSHA